MIPEHKAQPRSNTFPHPRPAKPRPHPARDRMKKLGTMVPKGNEPVNPRPGPHPAVQRIIGLSERPATVRPNPHYIHPAVSRLARMTNPY